MKGNMDHGISYLSALLHKIGSFILLPLMIAVVTLDVVLRYVFRAPLLWGEEVNGLLLILLLFFSVTQCWKEDKHVRMTMIYSRLKGRMLAIANVATALSAMIYFGLLGIQCLRNIPYMIKTHEIADESRIPIWLFMVAIFICSLSLVLTLLPLLRGSVQTVPANKEDK
jgi:TRAP-type C4-dicarboxylate transport system permease small subunit